MRLCFSSSGLRTGTRLSTAEYGQKQSQQALPVAPAHTAQEMARGIVVYNKKHHECDLQDYTFVIADTWKANTLTRHDGCPGPAINSPNKRKVWATQQPSTHVDDPLPAGSPVISVRACERLSARAGSPGVTSAVRLRRVAP